MAERTPDVYVLVGGGIDSTALLAFYLADGLAVRGIHFDYGQPAAASERIAARKVCEFYAVPITCVDLGLTIVSDRGEYRCRNAVLLMAAVSVIQDTSYRLALGIHSGTRYFDCSNRFVADVQRVLDGYTGGTVQVDAPFMDFTKADVVTFCAKNRVPLDLTFSCERQDEEHCGECPSCRDRALIRESG